MGDSLVSRATTQDNDLESLKTEVDEFKLFRYQPGQNPNDIRGSQLALAVVFRGGGTDWGYTPGKHNILKTGTSAGATAIAGNRFSPATNFRQNTEFTTPAIFQLTCKIEATTDVRFMTGLHNFVTDSSLFALSDLSSTHAAMINYDTDLSDTTMQIVTANGVSETRTDTGISISADVFYTYSVDIRDSSAFVFKIFDIDGNQLSSNTVTSTLPTISELYTPWGGIRSLSVTDLDYGHYDARWYIK